MGARNGRGQNMGGAFVNLTSDQDATLIGATSSVSEKS